MAAVGPCQQVPLPSFCQHENRTLLVRIAQDPAKPQEWLKAKGGQPLSFAIEGQTAPCLKPYWQVESTETFTCYPVIEPKEAK